MKAAYLRQATKINLFIGVMSYSQYAFVEGFTNEKELAWALSVLQINIQKCGWKLYAVRLSLIQEFQAIKE